MATQPSKARLSPKQKASAWGLVVASASLIASVGFYESSGKHIGTPYRDIVGVWTVCAGITGKHVIPGKYYSRQECADLEGGEIEKHALGLLACIERPIDQAALDALSSLAYNVGIAAACGSTIVRQINAGQPKSVYCRGLPAWSFAGGKQVQGLLNRRNAEMARCLA